MNRNACGFSPVLADKIVCWGKFDCEKLLAAGEPSEKVLIGGCPRLSREFTVNGDERIMKLPLDQQERVVMYATSPERQSLEFVELFCSAVGRADFISGMVRLHPSERLEKYRTIVDQHPKVRFIESHEEKLDASLASSDVVVIHGSGVGGDALVKRRPVVVLHEVELSGYVAELVKVAGCPHARTSEELVKILYKILNDELFREKLALKAEDYVIKFCNVYGEESARLTADFVRKTMKYTQS
jgi:hypothetical protein